MLSGHENQENELRPTMFDLFMSALQDRRSYFRGDPDQLPFAFRIPHKLRRENGAAYSPELVSIGPLHYNKKSLIPMENNKLLYMKSFLSRNANSYDDVYRRCIRKIQDRENFVRSFYAENISLSSMELAKVLVLDGCFILELLFYKEVFPERRTGNDPIFETAWMIPSLRRDLMLLENQIPFTILRDLWQVERGNDLANLMDFALKFFSPGLGPINKPAEVFCSRCFLDNNSQHLLDILRIFHVPRSIRIEDYNDLGKKKRNWQYMRRATALTELGVKFQCHTSEDLFDIEFNKRGVFKIPKLYVHENTEVLFRNLIALEQLGHRCPQYITSYALLIGRLLEDDQDVKILEQKKVLEVTLGPGQDVSSMFKDLCKGVSLRDFYFPEMCDKVDKFCDKRTRRYRAVVFREYLKEPWAIVSLMAVLIFLGVVPLVQTIYTVLSYYKQ